MTGPVTKNFAKFETFRLVQPVSVTTSRHLVRLIDDHKIPIRLRQFRREFLGAGQLINASDEHVLLEERVPGTRFLNGSARHDVETQTELLPKLVLPLLDQASRRHDQATSNIATDQQLTDEEARHDRLASTGIIGEQIPKRALLKELLVHRFDLVRVRLDSRRVDSSKRIREMSVLEPTRFRCQPK